MIAAAVVALAVAAVASPAGARAAARQTWPPFALVAGLLMIGVVAHDDGLFERVGTAVSRVRARPALLLALLGPVAAVTAVLNLDTSVAFLSPVLVLAARRRGIDEEPFLHGTLLMPKSAWLLLPGSNLTNLVVLARENVPGAVFAARMLPAWLASTTATAMFILVAYRHRLGDGSGAGAALAGATSSGAGRAPSQWPSPSCCSWLAVAGAASAGGGDGAGRPLGPGRPVDDRSAGGRRSGHARRRVRGRRRPGLGTLARSWSGPADLAAGASRAETAAVGAVAAVALNNLPAAVLLSARAPAHPGRCCSG